MTNKIHHIGLIVKSIDKSINIYRKLNYIQISEIIYDKIQNIKVCFVQSEDRTQVLELIESLDETSSIYHFKDGYHHICYEVNNQNFLDNFKNLNIGKIFTKPMRATAIKNKQVVFGCLNNGIFVEFLLNEDFGVVDKY